MLNQGDKDAEFFFLKAHKALNSAKNTADNDPDNAINRAYYSMFYAASGILAINGFTNIKTHQAVITKFGELFVKTGLVEKEIGKNLKRVENLRYDADYDPGIFFSPEKAREQIRRAEKFIETVENIVHVTQEQAAELPNMAEVQAAESKASMLQSLDRSADGLSAVEGQDIGAVEEGVMMAANEVKYEAQQARTANAEAQSQSFRTGQTVTFQAKDKSARLTGTVEREDEASVTLKCGHMSIPIPRSEGTFTPAPSLSRENTLEHAKEVALKALGGEGKVLIARNKGAYTGKIVAMTSTHAIQQVNANTTVVHRLKDLEGKEKDAQGLIKEGADLSIIRDGTNVSISQPEPGAHDNDKVRTQQKTRSSIGR